MELLRVSFSLEACAWHRKILELRFKKIFRIKNTQLLRFVDTGPIVRDRDQSVGLIPTDFKTDFTLVRRKLKGVTDKVRQNLRDSIPVAVCGNRRKAWLKLKDKFDG